MDSRHILVAWRVEHVGGDFQIAQKEIAEQLAAHSAANGGSMTVADLAGFTRAGHFAPVRLPGGEAAVKDPGRMAAAYLSALYGDDFPTQARRLGLNYGPLEERILCRQLAQGLNSPLTTSAGRLFDAVAAAHGAGVIHRDLKPANILVSDDAPSSPGAAADAADPLEAFQRRELDAVLLAVARAEGKVNIFNLGTDEYCAVKDSIGWICAELGRSPAISYGGGRMPLPVIERTGVLHVTDAGTRLYPADATEDDWRAFRACLWLHQWRSAKGRAA